MNDNLLIIDTLSHGPLVWDEGLTALSDCMLASGENPFKIVQILIGEMAKRVVTDPLYFDQYSRAWRECGVRCVSWTLGGIHEQPYSLEAAYHNYASMTHMLDNRQDFFVKVLKADDIERAHSEGKRAIILNFQNLDHIGLDLDLLDRFYQMGFRIMQLTYNTQNAIGSGCTAAEDPGLTEFGLSAIRRLNELGVLIDLSHCGTQTSMDAVCNSRAPVAFTHTFAKRLHNHDRGKDDALLKKVAEKAGYIGILAVPGFLTQRPETAIDDVIDHIDYVAGLVGIDHVGIGTDFFGFSLPVNVAAKIDELLGILGFRPEHRVSFSQKLVGIEEYTRFQNLIDGIRKRGYNPTEVKKIAGQNFLRVFRNVVG